MFRYPYWEKGEKIFARTIMKYLLCILKQPHLKTVCGEQLRKWTLHNLDFGERERNKFIDMIWFEDSVRVK